uniref:Predicted protein n=1 Tax=Hordeum vulgare subsp. vulgare TaxID=112509 RepID=F2EB62_HORVV|nr:predicted protein [Hordeum vulgare subsp. vulgare]
METSGVLLEAAADLNGSLAYLIGAVAGAEKGYFWRFS